MNVEFSCVVANLDYNTTIVHELNALGIVDLINREQQLIVSRKISYLFILAQTFLCNVLL